MKPSNIANHLVRVNYSDRLFYQNLWFNTQNKKFYVVTGHPLPNPFILPSANVFRYCTRRKKVFVQKWGDVVLSKDVSRQHIKFIEHIPLDDFLTDGELDSYNTDLFKFLTALGYGANKLKPTKKARTDVPKTN